MGIFFSLFPVIDLLYGGDMTFRMYYSIFYGVWLIITIFLILSFTKEYRGGSNLFDFKSAFRIMFIVSSIGLAFLAITNITLWNIFYPEKYIELNEKRQLGVISTMSEYSQSFLDEAYRDGSLSDEEYEEQLTMFQSQISTANEMIRENWNYFKENGISKTLFIGKLVTNLFFIIILNALLALIVRRKNMKLDNYEH